MTPTLLWLLTIGPAHADEPVVPAFGADLSAGIVGGVLLGEWPVLGPNGAVTVRYDAFIQDRDSIGPRLGLSIFATVSAWPVQDKQEEIDGVVQRDGELRWRHYGALMALRYDPAAPRAATVGLGFSRLDVDDFYDGVQTVPMVMAEVGYRQRALSTWTFLDAHLRAGWGNARGFDGAYTDWWLVQVVVAGGVHLR